jgi:CheY-like chemotaxis protein
MGRPRQRPARVAYDHATVAVRITHPGGGCRTAAVYARDLSTGGLSFLYPGYLHVGTAVSVALRRHGGGEHVAHGFVAWCRHVGGLWHGVGVGFAVPIAPAAFIDPAGPASPPEPPTDAGPADAPITEVKPDPATAVNGRGQLAGRVLYLEDQELDQALFLHTVRKTRLAVTTVDDAASALSAVAAGDFDLVCVDLNLGARQPAGERVMSELRAAGYAGPFVVVSEVVGTRLDRAIDAGDGGTAETQIVSKPYTAGQLLSALATALGRTTRDEVPMRESQSAMTVEEAPLHSQLAGQDGMAPLLRSFCDRARAAAADLDRLLASAARTEQAGLSDARPSVTVRQLCQMLRGAGRGYGYPDVSTAADAALRALEDGMNGLMSAADEVRELQSVCRRVVA